MRKVKSIVLSMLLATMLACGVLLVFPATAYAAQTIDITTTDGGLTIGGAAGLTSGGVAGTDSWSYQAPSGVMTIGFLVLSDTGPYTLTGTNTNLSVHIVSPVVGAEIILNGVDITASVGFDAFVIMADNSTVTLVGANAITASDASAFVVYPTINCTINGSGTLTASTPGSAGLWVGGGAALSITGSAVVTAVGAGVIGPDVINTLSIGDNATLTMTNNSGFYESHTFGMAADATTAYQWVLSGAATLVSGALTGSSITVRMPAGQTGTVAREPIPVAPTITSVNNFSCVTGTGGSFALTATGDEPITWSLDGTEPAGVSVSGSTLNVAASVPAGTYTFTIRASNGVEPDAEQLFTLTVTAAAVIPPVTPETGDSSALLLVGLLLQAALGAGLVIIARRQRLRA